MITVKELIAQLQVYDGDEVIVMALDPEGNGYAPLADNVEACAFHVADNEVFLLPSQLTDESREQGWGDDDVRSPEHDDNVVEAICLTPNH